jgi:hypothetical protein
MKQNMKQKGRKRKSSGKREIKGKVVVSVGDYYCICGKGK